MNPVKIRMVAISFIRLYSLFWVAGVATVPHGHLENWVRSALQSVLVGQLDLCRHASSLPEANILCRRSSQPQISAVAVYVSEPDIATDKVVAVLPDSQRYSYRSGSSKSSGIFSLSQQQHFSRSAAHDAVLVLDPTPWDNFGHQVFLFYVDMNVTKKSCSHLDGIYLGDDCVTQALKGRCQNHLRHRHIGIQRLLRGRYRHFAGLHTSSWSNFLGNASHMVHLAVGGVCDFHFLPLVFGVEDKSRSQRLRCVDKAEFAPCPRTLPVSPLTASTSSCELNKNTRRCHLHLKDPHLSCRLYQTCDHAILISGGWQQQMTFQHHAQKLQKFYRMLQKNGFDRRHIMIFFAGGGQRLEEFVGMYSPTDKAAIRYHVSYICRKQHCADSLILYLNLPAHHDGTMLLWDANLNGIAEQGEQYSINELLEDLAGCRASRVLLFVDQNYSGGLSKRLQGSHRHLNVILIPCETHRNHHSHWPNTSCQDSNWDTIGPSTCLMDHLKRHLQTPSMDLLNVTLAGAPCDSIPSLTHTQMMREYQGCQNLPTALWHLENWVH